MQVLDHVAVQLEMFPMDVEKREISVLFDSVSTFQLIQVLEFYNEHKPLYWNRLELLNRCEGGFKIGCSRNDKHLCWHNKRLVSHMRYTEFTYEEMFLLYQGLCEVFGTRMIMLQDYY